MIAVQVAAFAFADALVAATPGAKPFRAVAFLLSLAGHRRAGAPKPVELHRRIGLMAKDFNTKLRNKLGLDYDPVDIIEFNSFDDLLRKRPPGGTVWQLIMVVTHAGGEAPAEFPGEIFLGDKTYVVSSGGINDLLDAINAKLKRVNQFRAQFDDPSNLFLIGCGVGAAGPDVAIYMRELFGTEGLIMYPLKNVDFFPNGDLGTPKDPEKPKILRPLTEADWQTVTRKDDILNAPDPIRPDDF